MTGLLAKEQTAEVRMQVDRVLSDIESLGNQIQQQENPGTYVSTAYVKDGNEARRVAAFDGWIRRGLDSLNQEQRKFMAEYRDVNMRTVVNCCRAVVPPMRDSGGGAIVTMASQSALWVTPDGSLAAYGMAKAAVVQYTRYLAAEVGPWGIRVNCVAPGVIRTARLVAQQAAVLNNDDSAKAIPLRRLGEPSDVADAVQYLTTPLSAYVTGQVLAVDGGSTMR